MLSAKYNFSQRLLGVMCSDHKKPRCVTSTPRQSGLYFRGGNKKQDTIVRESIDTRTSDPEKNVGMTLASADEDMLDLSHYRMVNEVWHYCSVDWGARCKRPCPYLFMSFSDDQKTSALVTILLQTPQRFRETKSCTTLVPMTR